MGVTFQILSEITLGNVRKLRSMRVDTVGMRGVGYACERHKRGTLGELKYIFITSLDTLEYMKCQEVIISIIIFILIAMSALI